MCAVTRVHAGRCAAKTENYKGDLMNRTYYPTGADASNSSKRWYVIDAEGQTLGRLAVLCATYIRYAWQQQGQGSRKSAAAQHAGAAGSHVGAVASHGQGSRGKAAGR